ncbi:MAG: LPS assembly lipoprotein LptE [Deltaproteobacteria bacterium]|jgi:hypothetical protein|nr:LPS assembly lipoprotein LptE [Deltaproteobacteria bacterium]
MLSRPNLKGNAGPAGQPGRPALFLLLIALSALMAGGCGYGFAGAEPTVLGDGAKTMKVRGVENPTTYPWLNQILRSNLRDEIGARQVATWVDSGDSDYSIQLNVTSFTIRGSMHTQADVTLLYTAAITMQAIVYQESDNTEVWRSSLVTYSDSYETYYDRSAAEQLAKQAINMLVGEMRNIF